MRSAVWGRWGCFLSCEWVGSARRLEIHWNIRGWCGNGMAQIRRFLLGVELWRHWATIGLGFLLITVHLKRSRTWKDRP